MSYYPIYLNIKDKACLVIGGGRVAERKVLSLIEAGARVTVLSPRLTKELAKLSRKRKAPMVTHVKGTYKPGVIAAGEGARGGEAGKAKGKNKGFHLVISATDSALVNKKIYKEADALSIPVNVVDKPKLCSFIVPSLVKRGSLMIAISTSGKSPYLAKALRKSFEKTLPEETSVFVDIIGAVRNKLLKEGAKSDKKDMLYAALVDSPLLEWIYEGSIEKINPYLRMVAGAGYTLEKLGIKLGGTKTLKRAGAKSGTAKSGTKKPKPAKRGSTKR